MSWLFYSATPLCLMLASFAISLVVAHYEPVQIISIDTLSEMACVLTISKTSVRWSVFLSDTGIKSNHSELLDNSSNVPQSTTRRSLHPVFALNSKIIYGFKHSPKVISLLNGILSFTKPCRYFLIWLPSNQG